VQAAAVRLSLASRRASSRRRRLLDAAFAVMHVEAAAAARRIAAMEGAVHDTKRVKLDHFQ
jgi:hypothetical protein